MNPVWRAAWIAVACLGVSSELAMAQSVAPPVSAADPKTVEYFKTLGDVAATASGREEAASRLLDLRDEATSNRLAELLADASQPTVQLAIARSLGGLGREELRFVVPLTALIRADRSLAEAAVAALCVSGPGGQIANLLRSAASDPGLPDASRCAALRALGEFPDKSVPPLLLQVVGDASLPATVRQAAADGLRQLTGISSDPLYTAPWSDWWATNRELSPTDFRLAVLTRRDREYRVARHNAADLASALTLDLQDQLQRIPEADGPAWLLEMLRSGAPTLRASAARLIRTEAAEGRPPTADVRAQLRSGIADSDPSVRREVALVLAVLNDRPSAQDLTDQLSRERDADARAAQASALGPVGDVKAVPVLLRCLEDPATHVVIEAAKSLAELAPVIIAAGSDEVRSVNGAALELLRRQSAGTVTSASSVTDPLTTPVRAAAIAILLPDPSVQLQTLLTLTEQTQPPAVRQAALIKLGEFHDPASLPIVMALAERPAEPIALRITAIKAIAGIPGAGQFRWLVSQLSPSKQPLTELREQAWVSLQPVLPLAPRAGLAELAEALKPAPARRVAVLRCLAAQLEAAGEVDNLALVRQQIGESLNQNGQSSESLSYFQKAFDYWQESGRPAQYAGNLFRQTLDGLLRTQRFAEAATLFANASKWDATLAPQLLARIRVEAATLQRTGDQAGLESLILGFSRPGTSLPDVEIDRLRRIASGLPSTVPAPTSQATTRAGALPLASPTGP